jgi:hypothetical protein
LNGSISTSSIQPEKPSLAGECGMAAAISFQVRPASLESCTICWPL